jgi:cytochrome c oxidase subunit 2
MLGISAIAVIGITVAIFVFATLYRRRADREYRPLVPTNYRLEVAWIVVPLAIVIVMFVWGARVFYDTAVPPAGTTDIYVVGRQWMWKIRHPQGRREIDELHVPVGQPIKLVMTSEDVIHSFYVPAFRVKMDVLPGRWTTLWFEATRPGEYHLFCAEYCGTGHSRMGGKVVAMEPAAFGAWLADDAEQPSLTRSGQTLFEKLRCGDCHPDEGGPRGPALAGLFGRRVSVAGGAAPVVADEDYFSRSLLDPNAEVVDGYAPIMPTYTGLLGPEEVAMLAAYVKSLGAAPAPPEQP